MILITTSDYYPQLGGLTTFTENIINTLKGLGEDVEVFHWKKAADIKSFDFKKLDQYKLIINIHVMFCWLAPTGQEKMINFIHGSEILMTSSNLLKKLYKKMNKENFFQKMYQCYSNLYISNATLKKIKSIGYVSNVSRDIIFHNCINQTAASFYDLRIDGKVVFACIIRNVPHKNLNGTIQFCEYYARKTGHKVVLILPKNVSANSSLISIENLPDQSDESRENAYKKSHFNLLLSLDHSELGFFEGFGLTVLEAAKYGCPSVVNNTGGLVESTHHEETGFVIDMNNSHSWQPILNLDNMSYSTLRKTTYEHNLKNHGLDHYEKFFNRLLSSRKA